MSIHFYNAKNRLAILGQGGIRLPVNGGSFEDPLVGGTISVGTLGYETIAVSSDVPASGGPLAGTIEYRWKLDGNVVADWSPDNASYEYAALGQGVLYSLVREARNSINSETHEVSNTLTPITLVVGVPDGLVQDFSAAAGWNQQGLNIYCVWNPVADATLYAVYVDNTFYGEFVSTAGVIEVGAYDTAYNITVSAYVGSAGGEVCSPVSMQTTPEPPTLSFLTASGSSVTMEITGIMTPFIIERWNGSSWDVVQTGYNSNTYEDGGLTSGSYDYRAAGHRFGATQIGQYCSPVTMIVP